MQAIFSKYEHSYLAIMERILLNGTPRSDRTGVGTTALFGTELVHDWRDGFPLMTHRVFGSAGPIGEMVCFIKGLTNVEEFEKRKCFWWRDNLNDYNKRNGTPENLDLGPIYGSKWRNFHGIDQLTSLLREAEANPTSRRLLVTSWDPSDQHKAVLPPCHYSFQIFIDGEDLDLLFNMRSVDWVLGCPADMAAYGFLQAAICRHLGKKPRELRGNFADTHIYTTHYEGAEEILSTAVARPLPQWHWKQPEGIIGIYTVEPEDFVIEPFDRGPSMRFEMAV